MGLIRSFKNGNATVEFLHDGTRIINYEGELNLEFPLNVDIRVSTTCSFGLNPVTGKIVCGFCHEKAVTDGVDCDFDELKKMFSQINTGTEIAVGANNLTPELYNFLAWAKDVGYIVNLTINQGHLRRDETLIRKVIDNDIVKGIGVSYRSNLKWNVPQFILDYQHTVFHTIVGIDTITDVLSLREKGGP